jgi:hypothetical protein
VPDATRREAWIRRVGAPSARLDVRLAGIPVLELSGDIRASATPIFPDVRNRWCRIRRGRGHRVSAPHHGLAWRPSRSYFAYPFIGPWFRVLHHGGQSFENIVDDHLHHRRVFGIGIGISATFIAVHHLLRISEASGSAISCWRSPRARRHRGRRTAK